MEVIAFGEILYDIINGKAHLGGAPLNFAFYVNQFGIPVSILSAVGRDKLGTKALEQLKRAGVGLSLVSRANKPTGTVTVKLDGGQPAFTIHKKTAWDSI
jgi:fructokinase